MSWRSTTRGWGRAARLLHWATAALVLGQWLLGQYMTSLGPEALAQKFVLYQRHKSLGALILLVTLVRLAWRLVDRVRPEPPAAMPAWQRRAAAATHALLYLLLLVMPVTGFLAGAASPLGVPTVLFGVLPVPHPIGPDAALEQAFVLAHRIQGWAIAGLLALHVAAALKHHVIDRDATLLRMVRGG